MEHSTYLNQAINAVVRLMNATIFGNLDIVLMEMHRMMSNAMTVTLKMILILMGMGAHKIVKLSMAINVLTIPVSVHQIGM